MMPTYTQADRWMRLETALGNNKLLLVSFDGKEGVSRLFDYRMEVVSPISEPVSFDKIVGTAATLEIQNPGSPKRFVNGIVHSFAERHRDQEFIYYSMRLVPKLWRLTKRVNNQIFQRKTVAEIAASLLEAAGITYDLALSASYLPHNYCVQYQETDFRFLSRLLEEHGIHYYFSHEAEEHTLVLADQSRENPALPGGSPLTFDPGAGGTRPQGRIHRWTKRQKMHGGKVTLWDYSFELPTQNLQTQGDPPPNVKAGKVSHSLHLANNTGLESYEFPGGYAHMFDGVSSGGGDQESEIQNIFKQNERTSRIRMEEEAADSLVARGRSDCSHLTAGYVFALDSHFNGDGDYFITEIHAKGRQGTFRAGETQGASRYFNTFKAIPIDLPYRPKRCTRQRKVHGFHTAVVVGPAGEEIFTDKYGRVKVQFHWDRNGQKNPNSSCWLRMNRSWSGTGYGHFHLPRVGHEVLVGYVDGDIDQPLVVGSVHNASTQTPFQLPQQRTLSGTTSRSKNGTSKNASLFHIDDTLGSEQLVLHSENHMHQSAEKSRVSMVGWGQSSINSSAGQGGGLGGGIGSGESGSGGGAVATKSEDALSPAVVGAFSCEQANGRAPKQAAQDPIVQVAARDPMAGDQGAGMGGGDGGDWDNGSVDKVKGENTECVFGNDLSCTVGTSEEILIGASMEATLGLSLEFTVGAETAITVGPSSECLVGSSVELTTGNETSLVKGMSTESILGDEVSFIGGSTLEQVKNNYFETVGGNYFEEIGIPGGTSTMASFLNGHMVECKTGSAAGTEQVESYAKYASIAKTDWGQAATENMFIFADKKLFLAADQIVLCANVVKIGYQIKEDEAALYDELSEETVELYEALELAVETAETDSAALAAKLQAQAAKEFASAAISEAGLLKKVALNTAIGAGAAVAGAAAATALSVPFKKGPFGG